MSKRKEEKEKQSAEKRKNFFHGHSLYYNMGYILHRFKKHNKYDTMSF